MRNQKNLSQKITFNLFTIYFNISLLCTPRSDKRFFPQDFRVFKQSFKLRLYLSHMTLSNSYHRSAYPKLLSHKQHFPLHLNKVALAYILNSQFTNTETCAVVTLRRIKLQTKLNSTIPKSRIHELPLTNHFTLNPGSLFPIYT